MMFSKVFYLWGLLGLLVPLIIHLWSKREARTLKVGSIAWLKASPSHRSRSIQLKEWGLLLLRMLLLGTVVMLMAGPSLRERSSPAPLIYLVSPLLAGQGEWTPVLDSLKERAAVRLLAKGFPEWEGGVTQKEVRQPPHYLQLVPEMEALAADSIVVFVQGLAKGVKGRLFSTKKKIHWVTMGASEPPTELPLEAWRQEDDVVVRFMQSDAEHTRFFKQRYGYQSLADRGDILGDTLSLTIMDRPYKLFLSQPEPLKVGIYTALGFEDDGRFAKAAFAALGTYLERKIQLLEVASADTVTSQEMDVLVWLSDGPAPNFSGRLLAYGEDILADGLVVPGPEEGHFLVTGRLDLERATKGRLAEQLLPLLPWPGVAAEAIQEHDMRTMELNALVPQQSQGEALATQWAQTDLTQWFWLLLVVLFVAERILAYIKKH
ncbi:BatA domain-containing protein [Maribacter sp. 2307ULW6-5]|uniref:BatA domain-containing protein n=1 Tax=Maribacter sp. 2307ULW6-5 TaxID=3386275 RepID=UPI0039BC8759